MGPARFHCDTASLDILGSNKQQLSLSMGDLTVKDVFCCNSADHLYIHLIIG